MKRKKRSGTSLVLLLLACVLPAGAEKKKAAPQSYALVAGTVFQASGYALPDAAVTLTPNAQTDGRHTRVKGFQAVSDTRGEFVFRVPAASMQYTVKVAAKGYQSLQKSVNVRGEERIDITFQLEPESK